MRSPNDDGDAGCNRSLVFRTFAFAPCSRSVLPTMPDTLHPDVLLVQQIRTGKPEAWNALIAQYEGPAAVVVESRLRQRAASEDVVQETFIGFLDQPAELRHAAAAGELSVLDRGPQADRSFAPRGPAAGVAALVDRPSSGGEWDMPGSARPASSIARSGERRGLEEEAIAHGIAEQIEHWREKGDWQKIKCMELLFLRGAANKDVATALGISEQQVANFKFDFIARLRTLVKKQRLNEDVFPELYAEDAT